MAMLCPVCKKTFPERLQCPECNIRLQYHFDAAEDIVGTPVHWSCTPWGRMTLSVLLAQGLFYAAGQLLWGLALAAQWNAVGAWHEFSSMMMMQILQVVALFCGSALAGAGQRKGLAYGATVGVWNGVLFLMVQSLASGQIFSMNFLGLPILNAAFGAIGGCVGSKIWEPASLPVNPIRDVRTNLLKLMALHKRTPEWTTDKVSWTRVLAGVAVAVGGVVWADTILDLTREIGGRRLRIHTGLQETIMTLEISALAVFFGAALAGACTFNGSLQGAWTGIIASTVIAGGQLVSAEPNFQSVGLAVSGVLALSYLGGSFGAKLFPPMPSLRRELRHITQAAA